MKQLNEEITLAIIGMTVGVLATISMAWVNSYTNVKPTMVIKNGIPTVE